MPHAIGEEGVFAELARVKRERDEALEMAKALTALLRSLRGNASDVAEAIALALSAFPEKTEGK